MPCRFCHKPGKNVTTCDCVDAQSLRRDKDKAESPLPKGSGKSVASPASPARPIVVAMPGVSNHANAFALQSTLARSVRELRLHAHKCAPVAQRDGHDVSHCYYLRTARSTIDVDHTFECQLMGHALVQSKSWHPLFRQEGFIDQKVSKLGVLGKALDEVYAVQNDLANLHLLDAGINRSKAHVYTDALTRMYAEKAAGGFDLGHELEARCTKYFKDHDCGGAPEKVASQLFKEFEKSQRPIVRLLLADKDRRALSAPDARTQAERMVSLSEAVVQLYDDLGC